MSTNGKKSGITSCDDLRHSLLEGAGAIVHFERIPDTATPQPIASALDIVHNVVRTIFGTPTTAHVYHAEAQDSRALAPHTDPYDVVVVQLRGSKQWTTCVPHPQQLPPRLRLRRGSRTHRDSEHNATKSGSSSSKNALFATPVELDGGDSVELSTAHVAQVLEIQNQQQRGCTPYTDADTSSMQCSTFTLRAGDTMYLPKGVVHSARALDGGSTHATLSLQRTGLLWADAVAFAAARVALAHTSDSDSAASAAFGGRWAGAVRAATARMEGVTLLDAMPTWLLASTAHDGPASSLCRGGGSSNSKDTPDGHDGDDDDAGGGGGGDAVRRFSETFVALCDAVEPLMWREYDRAGDGSSVVDSVEIAALNARVCSSESAGAVLHELCTEGRVAVDVTSAAFRGGGEVEQNVKDAAWTGRASQRVRRETNRQQLVVGARDCIEALRG